MDMIVFNKNTGLVIAKTHPQNLDILYKDYSLEFRQSIDNICMNSSPKNIFDYKVYNRELVEIPKEELQEIKVYGKILTEEERLLRRLEPSHEEVTKAKNTIEMINLIQEVM